VEVLTVDDFDRVPDPVEDGDTLAANALKKAREIRDFTAASALADDTGLEVDALGGAPGVASARYASVTGGNASYQANCDRLLKELDGVAQEGRGARFRTVMALALAPADRERLQHLLAARPELRRGLGVETEGPDALVTEGIIVGEITTARRGSGGFGYDPVFLHTGRGKTLAEMTSEEKNEASHRYRALVEMRELLLSLGLATEG
jgi:XTP/dITP diphosphohydrolase